MECPLCGNEMRITGCETLAESDANAAPILRVYLCQTFACENPQCKNRNTQQVRHLLYSGAVHSAAQVEQAATDEEAPVAEEAAQA